MIPNTLEECVEALSNIQGVEEFKKISEEEIAGYHNGLGRTIRNNWGLWRGENKLCEFFHSIGIKHADDMSGIILLSTHRQLNSLPINLKEQVLEYWNHWIEVGDEEFIPSNIKGISEEYINYYKKIIKNNLKHKYD